MRTVIIEIVMKVPGLMDHMVETLKYTSVAGKWGYFYA